MTADPAADDLTLAVAVAESAGRLLMERFDRVEQVDFKSAKDIVTEVDHLSEALILESLKTRRPGDALLAEETGGHPAASDADAPEAGQGRTWIVDPLDGTINYANGIPFFCVAIGLVQDGCPIVGVIHDPVRGETFAATASGPATLGGRPVEVSEKERLGDFVVSLALSGRAVTSRLRAVRKAIRVSRSMGSAALALAYVGCGRFDAFVQQGGLSTWDIAAAGLIAERGGARVTDLDGNGWFRLEDAPQSIGVVAAPPAAHPAFLALVRGERPA